MASKLTLRELYKLHREDVDSQHDRIRSLIQDLVVRTEIPERSETERAFRALIQYLKLHFADEEQFMTACVKGGVKVSHCGGVKGDHLSVM